MKLAQITPQTTDRATFYGQTGSGKTTLVKFLISQRNDVPIFILDWKGLIRWNGFKRYTTLRAFIASKHYRKIYAPNNFEENDTRYHEAFFKYCYQNGKPRGKGCIVYVDEVSAIAKDDWSIPFWMRSCITRGRELNVIFWAATQLPVFIPQVVMSESEHHFCFALNLESHRKKVANMTGMNEETISRLISKEHKFIYANAFGEIYPPLSLTIKRKVS